MDEPVAADWYSDIAQPSQLSPREAMSVLDGQSPNTHADGWYGDVDDSITSSYSTSTMQLESASSMSVLHVIIAPILYGLITIVGATGNMLVIYVIVAKPRMRSVTNLLLLSLACADLAFVLVVPPFTAYQNATANWPFGDIGCRMMHYMVNVVAYVTVYTLVFIAGLRYATVVHGTETVHYRTRRNATIAAATIWAVMLAVNVPILMSYRVSEVDGFVICDIVEDQVIIFSINTQRIAWVLEQLIRTTTDGCAIKQNNTIQLI